MQSVAFKQIFHQPTIRRALMKLRCGVEILTMPQFPLSHFDDEASLSAQSFTMGVSSNRCQILTHEKIQPSLNLVKPLVPAAQFFLAVTYAADFPNGVPKSIQTQMRVVTLPLIADQKDYFPTQLHKDSGIAMQLTLFEDKKAFKSLPVTRFYAVHQKPSERSFAIEIARRFSNQVAIYNNDSEIMVSPQDINFNSQLLVKDSFLCNWRRISLLDEDADELYKEASMVLVGRPLELFHKLDIKSAPSSFGSKSSLNRLSIQLNMT